VECSTSAWRAEDTDLWSLRAVGVLARMYQRHGGSTVSTLGLRLHVWSNESKPVELGLVVLMGTFSAHTDDKLCGHCICLISYSVRSHQEPGIKKLPRTCWLLPTTTIRDCDSRVAILDTNQKRITLWPEPYPSPYPTSRLVRSLFCPATWMMILEFLEQEDLSMRTVGSTYVCCSRLATIRIFRGNL
jgi:hypothetical protein